MGHGFHHVAFRIHGPVKQHFPVPGGAGREDLQGCPPLPVPVSKRDQGALSHHQRITLIADTATDQKNIPVFIREAGAKRAEERNLFAGFHLTHRLCSVTYRFVDKCDPVIFSVADRDRSAQIVSRNLDLNKLSA